MAKTLAQKHADVALDEALQRVIAAYGLAPEDSMLVDYIVVAETQTIHTDEDGDPNDCGFALAFRSGFCRASVATGLLIRGMKMLDGMVGG